MPELPEVETLRRSLDPALLGRTITGVRVLRRDMISAPGDPAGGFSRATGSHTPVRIKPGWLLEHTTLVGTTRLGKQFAIEAGVPNGHMAIGTAPAIVIQLGMTGTVRALNAADPLPAHTHVLWTLDNGVRIAFIDPRRFGLVRALPGGTRDAWADLGPDALTIRGKALAERLGTTRRPIKAALLDQRVLAGVGNIYADESLFAARLHPEALACDIPRDRITMLASKIRSILRKAIDRGGSTIRDYRDSSGAEGGYQRVHRVYGRAGLPCRTCGGELRLLRVAQRATVVCDRCQGLND
jgi:formamidopyrimidine-DNA glycosylase